ncbi:hypothetical protein ILUMI_25432 [Ignelater luminosus]|uniref:DUF4817 domain-containing protein n=1 Tax=Ignelater luminosus TaxID=2038154 RepID=A0A8K0C8J4_IGNLU|nr:hypothetical protein ILUMI_25432 [Ignelater luminosus]
MVDSPLSLKINRYSTQQRIPFVEHYFKNDKSLTVTIRKLRPIFGNQNVPIEKFKKTESITDVRPSTRVRPYHSAKDITAACQNDQQFQLEDDVEISFEELPQSLIAEKPVEPLADLWETELFGNDFDESDARQLKAQDCCNLKCCNKFSVDELLQLNNAARQKPRMKLKLESIKLNTKDKSNESFLLLGVRMGIKVSFEEEIDKNVLRIHACYGQLKGKSGEEKLNFFQICIDHLQKAEEEKGRKGVLQPSFLKAIAKWISPSEINYSFDFTQKVHIPHDPFQPDTIYFLTPYIIGIFCIMCDTVQTWHNYLILESARSALNSDNYVAQNKNNLMIWVSLDFRSLKKKQFRVEKSSCLNDIADIVKSTAQCSVNKAVLAGTKSGRYLSSIGILILQHTLWKSVPKVASYYHYDFSAQYKREVKRQVDCV